MPTLYQKKNYTQGHLREKIREKRIQKKSYSIIRSELGIGSDRTIAKWSLSDTINSKSSAPINPHYKHGFEELLKLYCVMKYMGLNIHDSSDYLQENYGINIPRSTAGYMKTRLLSRQQSS